MSEFNNVTIVKKANVYFNGQVTSRTVLFADGSQKTLGIMMPGDYEFATEAEEIMEMLGGQMDVLLPGETEWKTFKTGDPIGFRRTVSLNSRFLLWSTTAAPTSIRWVGRACCFF